jgi:hypothetical protein
MYEHTYYYEVLLGRNIDSSRLPMGISPGIFSFRSPLKSNYTHILLTRFSDRVWKQGPYGGVKIIKDRSGLYGYVTNNEEMMKKFMWVKLQAHEFKKGA